ncbi:hypothetical protein HJC23_003563 [Cyclotella cryptica]|uniref:Rab3 GTPase-activating protein catalytic subunit n=1 Tax=Cyclotella cryptica TaxID=29204 RepID=A0ABD3PJI3_9STRA|eukprot:CCRYP_014214-RA/>CCRYP_014214-RA protein AED:0.01 eAED:0.01 QI:398/1/1/1/1/1/4/2456/2024
MSNTADGDGSIASNSNNNTKKSSRLKSIPGRSISKLKSKIILKRSGSSNSSSTNDRVEESTEKGGKRSHDVVVGKLYGQLPQDGYWMEEESDKDDDASSMEGIIPIDDTVNKKQPTLSFDLPKYAEKDRGGVDDVTTPVGNGMDEDDADGKPISIPGSSIPLDSASSSSSSSSTYRSSPVSKFPKLDVESSRDPVLLDPGQTNENTAAGVVKEHGETMTLGTMSSSTPLAHSEEDHVGMRRNESSTTTSSGGSSGSEEEEELVNGWKNVGKTTEIYSNNTKKEDDTIRGWRNVGVHKHYSIGNSDGSADSSLSKGMDGFLEEYPIIVDQSKDGSGVRRRRRSKRVSFHDDVKASPSKTAPTDMSPSKIVSLAQDVASTESVEETQREVEKALESTSVSEADSISCDGEMNIWNGNGMDIAVDETAYECDPDEARLNDCCNDADAAVDGLSCVDHNASTSQTQHETSSPTVNEPTQQPTQTTRQASKRSLQKARNQNPSIPTATSMLHLEYNVDHSCSTPLERLARDVGNAFRQWHVHKGCDRHVSFDWVDRMSAPMDDSMQEPHGGSVKDNPNGHDESVKTVQAEKIKKAMEVDIESESNPIMSMDLCMNRFASRSRKINEWMGDGASKVPNGDSTQANEAKSSLMKPPSPQAGSDPKERRLSNARSMTMERSHVDPACGARCIRSKKIMFDTTGFTPIQGKNFSTGESLPSIEWNRKRYSIPLILSLWDAPPIPTGTDEENIKDDNICRIPLSLRPPLSYSSHSLLGELGIVSSCVAKRTFSNHSLGCKDEKNQGIFFNHSIPPLDTGLGRDLSSLFNIGQHITLSLDLDSVQNSSRYPQEKKHLQDIDSLYNDLRAYLVDTIQKANERKSHAAQERQRRMKSLRKKAMKRRLMKERDNTSSKQVSPNKFTDYENIVEVGSQSMSYEDGEEQVLFYDSTGKENNSISNENCNHRKAGAYEDNETSSSDDDTSVMTLNQDIHLDESEINAEVVSSLTSILQSALNLAASENDCCIPLFGLWGSYRGGSRDRMNRQPEIFQGTEFAAPSWIPSGLEHKNNSPINRHASKAAKEGDGVHIKNLLLSSPAITGHCRKGAFRSTHRLYSIPGQRLPLHLSTLNGLSSVLLAQCPPHVDSNRVMLTSARHCYHVNVTNEKNKEQEWRKLSFTANNERMSAVELYRETCRRQALFLLERASSPGIYKTVPMWGPSEGNPLTSLSASVSWGVVPISNSSHEESSSLPSAIARAPPALLQLPLKIRSSNFVPSANELLDMEYSLQSTAFDPIGIGVESKDGDLEFGHREPIFFASARFDRDLPCATLSANTRCVLAALLRCGSLGLDTLPGHLTRKKVLTKLGGPSVASLEEEALAESEKMLRAALKHVGLVTTRLVDAMDWADVGTIPSNADLDRGIADALQRIGAGGLYPTPPVEVFATECADHQNFYSNSKGIQQSKGSPPGRLLSILFAHMARLRTPPSMMSLWLAFVQELRSRWDNNESLPNLSYVPGLDEGTDAQPSITRGWRRSEHRVLGHRAHLAAFVNSSEPDPDRDQCIINQKLQVFNICIECKLSVEAMHNEHLASEEDESTEEEDSHPHSDDDEFFDPEEEVSFESDPRAIESKQIEAMLKLEAAAVANPSHNRIGARCPVPDGLPLKDTGDQVYAPYLQRTMPMTDEEEEKQLKLSGVKNKNDRDERLSIRDRIQIAQRLQKPKLVSDMAAFKAANQGAVFEDFVSWYGNPQNPLCEEVNGETVNRALERRSKLSPEAAKVMALEEASEAIAILMSLRAFWEDSWEEAEPCPASVQQPLFDPYSTVEMVLLSFETIHPSILMEQALAVNLKSAEFVLETAAKPVKQVPFVQQALRRAVAAIHDAVEMLTKDSLEGCLLSSPKNHSDEYPLIHVSASTIQKCEEACDAIGEMELLLSRALALWQHCPDAELVDNLLNCHDESFTLLKSPKERSTFLNAIKNNQAVRSEFVSANHFPEAFMREYVMCNDDPDASCQLNARLVSDMKGCHSSLLAITKSYRD